MSNISAVGSLSGTISSLVNYDAYEGSYDICPSATEDQVLDTANRFLTNDITVQAVPYYETTNTGNGKTAFIASGVSYS